MFCSLEEKAYCIPHQISLQLQVSRNPEYIFIRNIAGEHVPQDSPEFFGWACRALPGKRKMRLGQEGDGRNDIVDRKKQTAVGIVVNDKFFRLGVVIRAKGRGVDTSSKSGLCC